MATKKTSKAKASTASAQDNVLKFGNFDSVESMVSESKEKLGKLASETAEFGQNHAEALMKSGTIFAKGFEELFKTYTELSQEAAERNAQAFKALLASKTINEYAENHAEIAQQNLDDFLGGATKLSELSVKLTSEAFEPLSAQATKLWNKSFKTAA